MNHEESLSIATFVDVAAMLSGRVVVDIRTVATLACGKCGNTFSESHAETSPRAARICTAAEAATRGWRFGPAVPDGAVTTADVPGVPLCPRCVAHLVALSAKAEKGGRP